MSWPVLLIIPLVPFVAFVIGNLPTLRILSRADPKHAGPQSNPVLIIGNKIKLVTGLEGLAPGGGEPGKGFCFF